MKKKILIIMFIMFEFINSNITFAVGREDFKTTQEYIDYLKGDGYYNGYDKDGYDKDGYDSDGEMKSDNNTDNISVDWEEEARQKRIDEALDSIEKTSSSIDGTETEEEIAAKQKKIDEAYAALEKDGIDTGNGIFSDSNLKDTRASIEAEKAEKERVQIENKYNQDLQISQDKVKENKEIETEIERVQREDHNDEALKSFDKNVSDADTKMYDEAEKLGINTDDGAGGYLSSDIIKEEIKKSANAASADAEKASNDYSKSQNEYQKVEDEYQNAKNETERLDKELKEAIDNGADIEEIRDLTKKRDEASNNEYNKQWELTEAEDAKEEAKTELEKKQLEKEKYNKALDASNNLTQAEKDKKAAEEAAANGKIINSPEQILEARKEEKQKDIDTAVSNINNVCGEEDTPECRAAVKEIYKAEEEKACLEPESDACKEAKALVKTSEDDIETLVADIKAKKEALEKEAAAKKAKEEEEAANPGLKRIAKGDESLMNSLLGYASDKSIIELDSKDKGGFTILSAIVVWFKDSLSSLIMLISVGAFLYVGIRLGMARGNPEEFKKGLIQMVYIVVGIFIITLAWAAVYLVAGLNI